MRKKNKKNNNINHMNKDISYFKFSTIFQSEKSIKILSSYIDLS